MTAIRARVLRRLLLVLYAEVGAPVLAAVLSPVRVPSHEIGALVLAAVRVAAAPCPAVLRQILSEGNNRYYLFPFVFLRSSSFRYPNYQIKDK